MTDSAQPSFQWLPHRAPDVLNKLVVYLLHSPFHWLLSNDMLLLTFTGRISGQHYRIPVSYFLSQGRIIIFSSNRWWKNLRGGVPVTILLKRQWVCAYTQATDDNTVVTQQARAYILQKGAWNAWRIGLELPLKQEQALERLEAATQGHAVIFVGSVNTEKG